MSADLLDDGTLRFLPTNLNRQPVVMGGLTADEMWATVFLCGAAGLVLGIPVAFLAGNPAFVLICGIFCGALGLAIANRVLRRLKRGRPETWFYRQAQFLIATHVPLVANNRLITRSGAWSCHRTVKQ